MRYSSKDKLQWKNSQRDAQPNRFHTSSITKSAKKLNFRKCASAVESAEMQYRLVLLVNTGRRILFHPFFLMTKKGRLMNPHNQR